MELKWYNYGDEGLKDGFAIREAVFVGEVGFSRDLEFDKSDEKALHLVCYDENKPVCNARIIAEGDDSWHFGRLCAYSRERGKGYGKACVIEAVRRVREELDGKKVTLGAKYDKKGFYESLGFTAVGDIFEEEGIPHINMYMDL